MGSPELLLAAFYLLWIGRNNRFGLPVFGGKANFAAMNENIRRLHMQKTRIRIGVPPCFYPHKRGGRGSQGNNADTSAASKGSLPLDSSGMLKDLSEES